ncbi:MAG: thioredoxin [Spirochaetes bacterium]|nr:thioredoxin [Spirochaetota bacterium]
MAVELLDANTFNSKIVTGKETAIVDFYANWCGPCRALGPILDSISENYQGKLGFYKIDVDKENKLAGQYNVMTIPVVMFFKNGEKTDSFTGAIPKDKIISFIEKNIKG